MGISGLADSRLVVFRSEAMFARGILGVTTTNIAFIVYWPVIAYKIIAVIAVVVQIVVAGRLFGWVQVSSIQLMSLFLLLLLTGNGRKPVFREKFTLYVCIVGRQLVIRIGLLLAITQVSLVGRQQGDVLLCQVVQGGRIACSFWCRGDVGRGDVRD